MKRRWIGYWWLVLVCCVFLLFLVWRAGIVPGKENQSGIYKQGSSVFVQNMSYVGRILMYTSLDTNLVSSGILMSKGSAVFVDTKGYVLTNKHVVEDLQAHYELSFPGGKRFSIRHIWLHPTLDLALLQVSGMEKEFENFPLPRFLTSQLTYSGQIGIGATLSGTVFTGEIFSDGKYYRINTSVLPGTSGSPFWDLSGNVLGLLTATSSQFSLVIPLSDTFVKNRISSL